MGNGIEPDDIDPQVTSGVSEINIQMALFEGLVGINPKTGQPEPGIASSWEVSTDQKTYTFHLRPEARWSDGTALIAQDILFSWRRLLNPRLAASNASLFFCIENAQAFNEGKIVDFKAVGIKATNNHTVVFKLAYPTPYFLQLLTHPCTAPVPPHVIEKKNALSQRGSGWTRPESIVSNGPFILKEWSLNQHIVVVRNPHYWDVKTVRLNEIHFYPYDSPVAEETAFRGKLLHITETIPWNKIASYRKADNPVLRIDPYLGTYYYILNTKKAPFKDPRVRQAFNLAINREVIAQKLLQAGQIPALRLIPPGLLPAEYKSELTYAPEAARRLLADAGYPEGQAMPTVEILYNTSENNRVMAEVLQQMLQNSLNINVELRNEEWKSCLESRRTGKFSIIRASWIADYPAAESFLDVWKSNSSNNFSGWSDSNYDQLLNKAARTTNPTQRKTLLTEAENRLLENTPLIPLYHYVTAYLIDPAVKNWYPHPLDWHPYKYIYLED
jgi:oligopeptide transport system substrate-binding protein